MEQSYHSLVESITEMGSGMENMISLAFPEVSFPLSFDVKWLHTNYNLSKSKCRSSNPPGQSFQLEKLRELIFILKGLNYPFG